MNPRRFVTERLAADAMSFPDIEPAPDPPAGMDPRDARLAQAIHRVAVQRWLTLEHLLDGFLRQPMRSIEPSLRGVLLGGAAQLLFLDRLPAHAVVDETVEIAKERIRPGAGGLVNAVLRKIAALRKGVEATPWTPARNRIPVDGGVLVLNDGALPAMDDPANHVAIATSHPPPLVRRWFTSLGANAALEVTLHGTRTPPVIVAGPQATLDAERAGFAEANEPQVSLEPHERTGFALWHGPHEKLVEILKRRPDCRVQDPASAEAVAATASLTPTLILDLCAGRGTKARQLALLHPNAQVIATDPDPRRFADLRTVAQRHANLRPVAPDRIESTLAGRKADLILLDVPCTNTGALARRHAARYRFNAATLRSLVTLQRSIIDRALPLASPGAVLVYSTCSLEPAENQEQAAWLRDTHGAAVERDQTTLPAGEGAAYRDGSYFALLGLTH